MSTEPLQYVIKYADLYGGGRVWLPEGFRLLSAQEHMQTGQTLFWYLCDPDPKTPLVQYRIHEIHSGETVDASIVAQGLFLGTIQFGWRMKRLAHYWLEKV